MTLGAGGELGEPLVLDVAQRATAKKNYTELIRTAGFPTKPDGSKMVYRAAVTGETAIIMAVVPLLTLVYLVASLLVDLLYAVLDPRIRYG